MWDDGLVTDFRLMEMLRELKAPAAFALNPARYGASRQLNNPNPQFGQIISAAELREYSDFEIVNHTARHIDLTKLSLAGAEQEITEGRTRLEDVFQRDVSGFCYPFGKHNARLADILRRHLYLYGRTCQHTDKKKNVDPLMLYASAKWDNHNFDSLIERTRQDRDGLIFWGHTYEMKEEKDWQKVRKLYEWLLTDPRVKLVSFKEMVVATTLQSPDFYKAPILGYDSGL
jgi:peptidoglycan/xylan/chitin deacetylase (PgdA/CDA1 family)